MEIDPNSSRTAPELAKKAWDIGLSFRPIGNNFAMSPPLTIDEEHIGKVKDMLTKVLR